VLLGSVAPRQRAVLSRSGAGSAAVRHPCMVTLGAIAARLGVLAARAKA
jgi:hypothetical protein